MQHCPFKGNQQELVNHRFQQEAHYSSLNNRCKNFYFGQQYISDQKYFLKNRILHVCFLNIGFWDIKEARLVSSCAKCHDATSRSRQRKRPCLYFIVWIWLIKKMTQHKICNFLFDTFLNLRRSVVLGLYSKYFVMSESGPCGVVQTVYFLIVLFQVVDEVPKLMSLYKK